MAIDTYTGLAASVESWLARSDFTSLVPDFIALAEKRIYREMRLRCMETALNETISSGVIAVPSDYLELKHAYIETTPVQVLERTSQEIIYSYYPTRSSDGVPKYIATEGTNFIFGPYPDSTYAVKGTYYAKLTALSGSNETNWFTANAPELILFGALVEAADYAMDLDSMARWLNKFEMAKMNVLKAENAEMFSGSILTTRAG